MLTELFQKAQAATGGTANRSSTCVCRSDARTSDYRRAKENSAYSNKNSIAANPDPKDSEVPKIDGKQTEMVKTEDVPRQKVFPLSPTPPLIEIDKEEHPEIKPKATYTRGDLTLAKPETGSAKIRDKATRSARAR